MINLLHIDTTGEQAVVCLSEDGELIAVTINQVPKDHASFIHTAIQMLCKETSLQLEELHGVVVSNGPGSYTGLRVGLSTAKGICYALDKKLILVSSLELLAAEAIEQASNEICTVIPLIDARRMEVFTAAYTRNRQRLTEPQALILNALSFDEYLNQGPVYFIGDGMDKFRNVCTHPQARFLNRLAPGIKLAKLGHEQYVRGHYDDLGHAEPFYVKEHQSFNNSF
ncbi:MAG: tRNA (adenosine(37)-N6)-threonylcarbamoyltransferase complex dimerization subunit type 1 TsaB [Ferruginibacter sp.]